MPAAVPSISTRPAGGRYLLGSVLVLAVLTALLQGRSVGYGLVLDDYNHRAELREGDWSFRSLVDASHLGDPRRRVRMWWQEEADLYFFRPLAFAIMRATYVAGGWRPDIMHAASLGWGVICAWLVLLLARQATGSTGWGLLAGVVFLMHPANFLTPRWIACQNEQMATAFTLAGLLCYGRYAGWWTGRRGSPVNLAATLVCYVAALGCRESAIILPALLLIGDWAARTGDRPAGRVDHADSEGRNEIPLLGAASRRTPEEPRLDVNAGVAAWAGGLRGMVLPYLSFAMVAVAYLLLRRAMLGPLTIPGRPYAWPVDEPGFVTFVVEKFVYYILGLWAYIPIIGFAGQEQMRSQPGLFYGLFAFILIVWVLILSVLRPGRKIWLWLGLSILPLGPVLPVFASAHHLYLASAGMAVATIIAMRALVRWTRQRTSFARRAIRFATVGLAGLALLAFTGANFVLDNGVAGLAAACQLPIRQTVELARPIRADDKLFFINLPMLAFNCVPAIEEARGVTPLHGYVLTFAPEFLRMDRPARVEPVDEHRLRVRLQGPGYFSGLIGRSILQGIDRDRPFSPGETFDADEFTVEVIDSTDAGVQEFLFTFRRPLSDPAYHFFLASPVFDSYPLRFD